VRLLAKASDLLPIEHFQEAACSFSKLAIHARFQKLILGRQLNDLMREQSLRLVHLRYPRAEQVSN